MDVCAEILADKSIASNGHHFICLCVEGFRIETVKLI